MRTKTLLITAALTAAGALSSMAQVYSVNIVGYVNLQVPQNFSIIANQLNNSPDNSLNTLLPAPPEGSVVYKYDPVLGFGAEQFSGGVWSAGGLTTLAPGEGAFVYAAAAFTATFVGEVKLSSDIAIPPGFSIVSSVIPQAGNLYDPTLSGPDLGYGAPPAGSVIYQYNNSLGYGANQWDGGSWSGSATGPNVAVGEGFFNYNAGTAAYHWTRTFTVGP